MTLKKALLELKNLLLKWGISTDEWFLMLHYSDILQGYNMRRHRDEHLHIMITKKAIPWPFKKKNINREIEIPPNSKYFKNFSGFINKTNHDFHILAGETKLFNELKNNYSTFYQIRKQGIRMTTVMGNLIFGLRTYSWWEKEVAPEVRRRRLLWTELLYQEAKKRADKTIEKYAGMVIEQYMPRDKEYEIRADKAITNFKSSKIIKGQIAFKGKACGKVLLIKNPDQPPEIKKGFILVAKFTSPKLISFIRFSKAVITDEGGIISHAAITARELKKPCIIGTKIATKVLRDGDLVEVDAVKGIIKILKRLNIQHDNKITKSL